MESSGRNRPSENINGRRSSDHFIFIQNLLISLLSWKEKCGLDRYSESQNIGYTPRMQPNKTAHSCSRKIEIITLHYN